MNVFVAEAGTERPDGSEIPEAWIDMGTADDSTLPSDPGVMRLQMRDAEAFSRDPASAYIPDLGVHETDVAVEIDDTGVLSITAHHHM
jgi:hypothetical protein